MALSVGISDCVSVFIENFSTCLPHLFDDFIDQSVFVFNFSFYLGRVLYIRLHDMLLFSSVATPKIRTPRSRNRFPIVSKVHLEALNAARRGM
jgi:hypothetical protein